jgi:putative hydrolase
MIDLHTHTTFSDGALIPAELARRARVAGYKGLAFTDHVDDSNLFHVLENLQRIAASYSAHMGIDLFVGLELTHNPPALIPGLVQKARLNGAQLVLVHGETMVEPVEEGTNLAAIEAGVDILAHPGLITAKEVELAAVRGVHLEITTRKGHSLSNGHVVALARRYGAKLVINNDTHEPGDLIPQSLRRKIAFGAGMTEEEYLTAENNSRVLVSSLLRGSVQT